MRGTRWLILAGVLALAAAGMLAARAAEGPRKKKPKPPPSAELKVRSGKLAIAARVVGAPEQPAIIAVHSGPGWSHQALEPLGQLANAGYRVVFYDQRGAGGSARPKTHAHHLRDQVADLEAVRAALGAAQVVVLGHGWGGLVAMAYAAAHPKRVRSLALVAPFPPYLPDWHAAAARFRARVTLLRRQGLIPRQLPPVKGGDCRPQRAALMPAYWGDPRHSRAALPLGGGCRPEIERLTWAAVGWLDQRQQVGSLRVPVWLAAGGADPYGSEMTDAVASALSVAAVTRQRIESCGHFPWLECPEAFFSALRSFLQKAR